MANPYLNLIRTVWHYGQPWHRSIVSYYFAFIIAQGFMSLSPYAFGRTIDLLQNFTPERFWSVIFWLVLGVALVPLFWLFHGPARVLERKVALKIQQAFRINLYEQLTKLPLKWHQDHHSGNIITRVNRASTALHRFAEDQFIYIETIVKFFVSIGFLMWISLPVGLISLVSCLFATLVVILFDRKLIPLYESENEVDNHVGAVFFDYISNMTTILTLRLGELTRSNLSQRIMSIWPFFNKEAVINEVKWFTMGIALSVTQSLILIGYIVFTLKKADAILIGTVVMIFRYQWDLSEVFYNLSAHYSDLVHKDTDIKGLQPVLDDIKALAHLSEGVPNARQWHTIEINSLEFHHTGTTSRGTVHSLDFNLKRGEKIALIGTSGAGKSTLLNLLSGLYTPDSVHLTVDRVSFNSLEPLQALTTLIPQEPEIFENTIAFNITMDLEAQPSEIDEVVTLAGFSKVLAILPSGLATDIREKGLNLSVGQKQRLALARGLFAARFSSLILMDEPTSSVDLATEKTILSSVIDSFPSATLIVSLHRLHLLPKFDRIIMLDHGKIVADGATDELLNNPGPVSALWHKYHTKSS
jgi:ATP-binding cassette subfamily B protein